MQKNIYIIFYLVLCNAYNLSAQWQSKGCGINLSDRLIFNVSVPDSNTIWGVANRTNLMGSSYEFCRSVNGGATWQVGEINDSIGPYYPIQVFALDTQTAWILMIKLPNQDYCRLFKTANGGITWNEQVGDFNNVYEMGSGVHFFNSQEGILFGSAGTGSIANDTLRIYRTTDGGGSWLRVTEPQVPSLLPGEAVWLSGMHYFAALGDTLWFGTRKQRVFRTTNRGGTWEAFPVPLNTNNKTVSSLAFESSTTGIALIDANNRIARTTDGGATWTQFTIPTNPSLNDIQYIPGTKGTYLISEGWFNSSNTTTKCLMTKNSGTTWDTLNFLPALSCMHFISPFVAYAGSNIITADSGGVYRFIGDFSDSVLVSISRELVSNNFQVVFPNPTHNTISLVMQGKSDNRILRVYNATGQLVDEFKMSSPHIEVSTNSWEPGVYQYNIIQGEHLIQYGKIVKQR